MSEITSQNKVDVGLKFATTDLDKQVTVRSLAPICSSLTSTMFSELILRQSHTARQRQINGKEYSVSFLGPN